MVSAMVRRMPAVVVVIGFLILVPSLLGFLFFGLGAVAGLMTPNQVREEARRQALAAEAVEAIIATGVSRPDAERCIEDAAGPMPPGVRDPLKPAVALIRTDYQVALAKRAVRTGAGFVMAFLFLFGAFIGWLLIRKKQVLRCGHCGATIAGW